MNILKLKYFLITAEELNISKASKRLFITQQALSSQISQIEKYYGVRLFNRKPTLALTREGKFFQQKAKDILKLEQEFIQETLFECPQYSGTIRIGYSHAGVLDILIELMKEFQVKHPLIQYELLQGSTKQINTWLSEGTIDFLIGLQIFSTVDISTVTLSSERVCMVYPLKNSLNIAPGKIPEAPLLLLSHEYHIRKILDLYLPSIGYPLHVFAESNDLHALLSMCRQNLGITFCPESVIREQSLLSCFPELAYEILEDCSLGPYTLSYMNGNGLPPAVLSFIKLVKEKFYSISPKE